MARPRTRGWIRAQARELADEVGSTFITDATANDWINQSHAGLVDLLVSANPDWCLADVRIQTTAGVREYAVPDDFYEVRGVDLVLSGDVSGESLVLTNETCIALESYNFIDRNRDAQEWPPPRHVDTNVRYRVIRKGTDGEATRLRFEPDPGSRLYRLWYVQTTGDLVADNAELDGVNGYEEYIVAEVALKMLIKSESDTTGALHLLQKAQMRIQQMASKRDQGKPVQVADTRSRRTRY